MSTTVMIDFNGFEDEEKVLDFISKIFSEADWEKGQGVHVQVLSETGKEVINMALENLG